MNILKKMLSMISFQENLASEGFILRETSDDKPGQGGLHKDKHSGVTETGDEAQKAKAGEEHAAGGRPSGRRERDHEKSKLNGDQSAKSPEGAKAGDSLEQDGKGEQEGEQGRTGQVADAFRGRGRDGQSGNSPRERQTKPSGNKRHGGEDKDPEGRPGNPRGGEEEPGRELSRWVMKRPLRTSRSKNRGRGKENDGGSADAGEHLSAALKYNREMIQKLYGLPENKDVVIRDFVLGTVPPVKGFAVFMDGLTDKALQDMLFQALMLFTGDMPSKEYDLVDYVKERLLPANQLKIHSTFREVLDAVNYGETAIILEGYADAITVETKGWEHRGIDRPVVEQIIRGPQEAFGETIRSNTALIRKRIRNENLVTEFMELDTRDGTDVAVMYLRDLTNPELVAEVKRRIKSIKVDYLSDSGLLEQFIEDSPYDLNPQVLATERPDRVAAALVEGRIAILVDGTPFVLVVPTTMYELLHTGEENYLRWQYGTFLRYVRTLSFYLAFLLPGFYLAVVLFHHEMIPTELLLAIAGNRERVPFPSVVEVLLMELSFELIREGSLRIPGIMGTTIGIVGALILGQAAVQANIVSPILVILVGVTGLANFSIPNYSLSFALRIYRFMYIALGSTMGFFGITLGLAAQILLTANLKSFGVPYLSPAGPRTVPGSDVVTRLPVFLNEKRPDYLNPRDSTRQPEISRGWVNEKRGGGDD